MKVALLSLLPRTRWIPHDLPTQDTPASPPKPKSRNPFSKSHTPSTIPMRPRISTTSLTSAPDATLDLRTRAQSQSMFFTHLPLEIRKMIYEFVMGEETVHLTFGSKKRFGHFVCEDDGSRDHERRECGCRVLDGVNYEMTHLDSGCMGLVRSCRRM
jgi:hypothetical protein